MTAERTYAEVVARGGADVAEAGVPPPRVAADDTRRRTVCLSTTERSSVLRTARHAVAAVCQEWGVAEKVSQVATLLTSEIVANATHYAHPPCHLIIEAGSGWLVVCCQDCGKDVPVLRAPDVERPGGRGLMMLQKLTARWGYDEACADPNSTCCRVDPDKQVWFAMQTD